VSLLAELRQRKMVQWLLAYLAGAWVLLQVADMVGAQFGWPAGLMRGFTIAAAVGVFVVLLLAWYHGERGAQRVSSTELLLLALLLAIGGGLLWKFAPTAPVVPAAATTNPAAATAAPASAAPTAPAESIAVLPFLNLSADPENEFFSDGLSEEILNSLARIDGMQVVGRTSSFQFKGKNQDLRVIGKTLGVATVLEGSVRREGNKARITAQLIRAADGIHLWSQTYDRTVDDSFAVQLDIAEQVAGVLQVVLDDTQRARMRRSGLKDVDAYIAYQRGLKLYDEAHRRPVSRDLIEGLRKANAEFDRATRLEPGFSTAYYQQGDLYNHILLSAESTPAELREAQAQALQVLQKAADTSQDLQLRLITRVERQLMSDDWRDLAVHMQAAMDAPGCNAPNWLPVVAGVFGEGDRVENLGARVYACDPLNSIQVTSRITSAMSSGNPRRAQALLQLRRGGAGLAQLRVALMQGQLEQARKLLLDAKAAGVNAYDAELLFTAASGGDVAAVRQSPAARDWPGRGKLWQMNPMVEAALAGDRAEANRLAALLDARPAGALVLAVSSSLCLCGAPFDLEATPNFRKRLAEGALPWPPKAAIRYPTMAAGKAP
jgi:adenylate cyclase